MQQLPFFLFWYLSNLSALFGLILPFAFVLLLPMLPPKPSAEEAPVAKLAATHKKKNTISIAALTRVPEFIENLFIYLERRNLFQCVNISVRISPLTLTRDLAYSALRGLVLKYPLLALFPEGEGRSLRWQTLGEIRFFDVFELDEDVDVCFTDPTANTRLLTLMAVTKSHQQKKPLWKLVYYKNTGWLTFQSAHCFTDGSSVVAYLKDFVELLNSVEVVGFKDILFKFERDMPLFEKGISPLFFDRVMFIPDYTTRIAILALKAAVYFAPAIVPTILETFMQNLYFVNRLPVPFLTRSFFKSPFLINADSPLNNATTTFINLPHDELAKILRACRVHGVKLLTYVLFVYVQTVHEVCPGAYIKKFLNAAVAVNLRKLYPDLQTHNKYLGNGDSFDDGFYSFVVKYFIEPGTLFSWQTLRKYHDFLHNTIDSTDWIKQYYVASHTITAENYMNARFDKVTDDTFLFLTNLGQIDFLDYENSPKFQIEDILFSPSIGATLGTHHIALCSTAKSGLNIGLTDGDVRVKDWHYFRFKLRENLLKFLSEQ